MARLRVSWIIALITFAGQSPGVAGEHPAPRQHEQLGPGISVGRESASAMGAFPAGKWRSECDAVIDGQLEAKESPVIHICTANDRLTGHYHGRRPAGKKNRSVFTGHFIKGTPALVSLRQDDRGGYTAVYTGKLVSDNRFSGTYMDNRGYCGDWSLVLDSEPSEAKPVPPTVEKDGIRLFHAVTAARLSRGARVPLGNGHHEFVDVPQQLEGRNFTPRDGYQGILRFEVVQKQRVYVAIYGQDWGGGGNSSGGWKKEQITRQELENDGWQETTQLRVMHSDPRQFPEEPAWIVFERVCQAGESFALRTHKYQAPVLIWGPGS